MPQGLCRALAWEQQRLEDRALAVSGMVKRSPTAPALSTSRQEYLRTYWSIAEAVNERNPHKTVSGSECA